jgi:hypothetical protein
MCYNELVALVARIHTNDSTVQLPTTGRMLAHRKSSERPLLLLHCFGDQDNRFQTVVSRISVLCEQNNFANSTTLHVVNDWSTVLARSKMCHMLVIGHGRVTWCCDSALVCHAVC